MLKSKNRVLAVTVAVIAVAVFAVLGFVLGNGTLRAYADEKQTNSWTEVNVQSLAYGDAFVEPTVKSAYGTPSTQFYKVEANGTLSQNHYEHMTPYIVSGRVPAGKYALKATVVGTETYTGLETVFYFDVKMATNAWIVSPNVKGWAENETPNLPEASAKFGEVNVTVRSTAGALYYQARGNVIPTNRLNEMKAGTYVLTASVNGDEQNYTGIPEYRYEFRVYSAVRNEWKITPSISDYTLAENPRINAGEALYSDGSHPEALFRQAGASNESATAVVPRTVGDWVMVVTVKRPGFVDLVAEIPFTVTMAKNEWTTLPAIQGWTAGETANAPTGTAKAGMVQFSYSEDGKTWSVEAPTEAGEYYMQAFAWAEGYDNMVVEVPFTVARDESNFKQNAWKTVPNIQGWREGKKANDPVGEAENGTVTFTYRNMDGTRVERPSMAGDYILVATVEAEGYEIMVGEVQFTVAERIVIGDNAGFIAGICVLSAIVAMLIVACVILFIRSKGMTVKQAFGKIFKR